MLASTRLKVGNSLISPVRASRQQLTVKNVASLRLGNVRCLSTPSDEPTANRKVSKLSVEGPIDCHLSGFSLLNSPLFNKGSAFTEEERKEFHLNGLLPSAVNTLEQQAERAYRQFKKLGSDLEKNEFCTSMRIQNKVLFYELVRRHIKEIFHIIYTPTEGDAIMRYSYMFRKPEGCFLDITRMDEIDARLQAFGSDEDVDYIVVSDGEGVLGIGDQGVGGVRIAIAKLALMTICGGIHPGRVIPVVLDTGTNNEHLYGDELYLGNKFPRVRGEKYYEFVDKFVQSVKKNFPSAVLHFEDFGVKNARTILQKYRDELPCFNDDIQGTGAVVMSSITAAFFATKQDLKDIKVVVFGAGSAGLGVADQIVANLVAHGCTLEEARAKINLVDRPGLLLKSMDGSDLLTPSQAPFAKDDAEWEGVDTSSLLEIVKKVKPNVLIGCSTKPKAFTEEIVKAMYKHCPRPIIFPLSNPTRLHEAFPADLLEWTEGNALIATGSPFNPVNGKVISENNNCFTFPGIGLGAVLSRASSITDNMIAAAVEQLAKLSPILKDPNGGLLPDVEDIREVSALVAVAVAQAAVKDGVSRVSHENVPGSTHEHVHIPEDHDECLAWVKTQMWKSEYRPMRKVETEHLCDHRY